MIMEPSMWLVLGSIIFSFQWTGSLSTCSETTRVRKPWHALSEDEQLLYSLGFQRLHREGLLIIFFESHDDASTNYGIHQTTQNFFWHSYWLYEMENSFRRLGGEYECFTLPYWDVTNDAEYWNTAEAANIEQIPIYNSNLGGNGNIDNDFCVEDPIWNVDQYTTEFLCADDEVSPNCCLKRFHTDSNVSKLSTRAEISDMIYNDKYYHLYDNFFKKLNYEHEYIHNFIGSVMEHTHFNPTQGEPEVDPLFPLFHAFIDFIRLMRTDCWQYDLVDVEDLDDYIPYSFNSSRDLKGTLIDLDYDMTFSVLCDGTDEEGKRLCSEYSITPRLMYDMSPNRGFGIVYELGDFWSKNDELQAQCGDNLNSTWWRMADTDPMGETESFMIDHVLRSIETTLGLSKGDYYIQIVAVLLIGMAIISMLKLWGCTLTPNTSNRKLMDIGDGGVYGA